MSVQFGYLFMPSGMGLDGYYMGPLPRGIDKCWLSGWLSVPPQST